MALSPSRLSDFRLTKPLGRGSTAKVFEATHVASGTAVAIKILESGASSSPELKERLAREAVLLAGLSSPHVGRILGFGYDRDNPFLVLERLRGETLDAMLRRDGPVPLDSLARWIDQLLAGIRDCHAMGIIHRDIKPANIFLARGTHGTNVRLIDFGVARIRDLTGANCGLTSTHHLLGSMGYMAPEQFHDAKGVGPTADLYGVGVVVFRCTTGRLPFVHRSIERVIKLKCETEAPLISSMPTAPRHRALDAFVARALHRDPRGRFQSAREMMAAWGAVAQAIEDGEFYVEATDVLVDADHAISVEQPIASSTIVECAGRQLSEPPLAAYGERDEDGPTPFTTRMSPLFEPEDPASPSADAPTPLTTRNSPSDIPGVDMPTRPDNSLTEILRREREHERRPRKKSRA